MKTCIVCESGDIETFSTVENVPVVCNALLDSEQEARSVPTANVALSCCQNCGHVFNAVFQPSVVNYAELKYENSLYYSQTYQNYARKLARHLFKTFDLRGKKILEIGCGDGRFLSDICSIGSNQGIGFEPSGHYRSAPHSQANVSIVHDFFDVTNFSEEVDFVICRHVLEHLANPLTLLENIAELARKRSVPIAFYFEVPNSGLIFDGILVWDVIYEHVSYFTTESLRTLLRSVGYEPTNVRLLYHNQYIGAEGFVASDMPSESVPRDSYPPGSQSDKLSRFDGLWKHEIEQWETLLEHWAMESKSIVVWGAGSKGVTFLNLADSRRFIKFAVDVNPSKQQSYVPVTGQRIVAPQFLREYRVERIVVANPVYLDEISETVSAYGYPNSTLLPLLPISITRPILGVLRQHC